MANFNAYSFIYDGIPCDIYGLMIADFDGNGEKEQDTFSSQIRTVTLPQSYEHIFMGYESKDPLQFQMTMVSENKIDAYTQGKISEWLLNRNGFLKLQVIQADLTSVIYYCMFTKMKVINIAGYTHAFTVDVLTNSPYQYENNKIISKVITTSGTMSIVNNSDINDYIYPNVTITSTAGGNVTITNTSDANRAFTITGLASGEVITISGKCQTLVSSTSLNRLGNFNKHWMRLKRGTNALTITGSATISFEIPVIRMVGTG